MTVARTCLAKRRFETKGEAKKTAGYMNAKGRGHRPGMPLTTYRCCCCDGYHIGQANRGGRS